MAIEVDPDQAAGDAALVTGERPGIGRSHGVDGSLLAGNAVGDGLRLGKRVVADLTANGRSEEDFGSAQGIFYS